MCVKICTACGVLKAREEYYKKGDRIHSKCIPCHKAYYASEYRNKPARRVTVRKAQTKYRKNTVSFIRELKDNKECMDCKLTYPHYVLDFDHRPDEQKLVNISSIASRKNWTKDKVLAEIAKCDLVCANCHRIRTWIRLNPPQ